MPTAVAVASSASSTMTETNGDGPLARPEQPKKRFSLLNKVNDLIHHNHKNGHASGSSSGSVSPNGNVPGGKPVKRATTPSSGSFDSSPSSSRPNTAQRASTFGPLSTFTPSTFMPQQSSPSRPSSQLPPPKTVRRETSNSDLVDKSNTSNGSSTPASKHGSSDGTGPAKDSVLERVQSNGSVQTTNSISAVSIAGSSRRVQWAQGVDDESTPRPRRPSSTGTRRRSSIYFRNTEGGDYLEGVDAGVGSKARRLSVSIPSELNVESCRLEEHFNLLSRKRKKKVGEGGAAEVQLMQSKTAGSPTSKVYAVKEFRPWDSEEETETEYIRKIKSEYAIAKSCDHPNIVETFRLCTSKGEWFHVMEYCEAGDLNDLIKTNHMKQEERDCMFKQLLRGVDYLHTRGLAHRDIKSENLLVSRSGCLKIADFGTSEVFCGPHPGMRRCRRPSIIDQEDEGIRLCKPGQVGSRPYMAPEVFARKEPYDARCVDAWSCAIVYLSLCFNGTPWDCASDDVKNYHAFLESFYAWLEEHPDGMIERNGSLPAIARTPIFNLRTPGARWMVVGMLHPDPKRRWPVSKALAMVSDKNDKENGGPWPCCQQDGYSDDILTREKKVRHRHLPPEMEKKLGLGK